MKLLDRLERKFGRYAVPNVTIGLVLGQVLVYVPTLTGQGNRLLGSLQFVPSLVLEGQVWRLFTFLLQPPLNVHPIFMFFFWYIFYLMGTALERTWGVFRYNLFLLIGYVATVGVSLGTALLTPFDLPASNGFLQGTVFLAFAYLYPDFRLALFFILPIKIKWLALIQWIGYLYAFGTALVAGNTIVCLVVAASVVNFFVFFGKDLLWRVNAGRRRMADKARRGKMATQPRHRCTICGVTDKSDPGMSFRYCSKCEGSPCYCENHLRNHQHVAKDGRTLEP